MENTWPWLLGTVLAGAVAYFVGLGLAQSRRARRLVRQALDLGFRFEKEDSLDLPGRLGDFVFFGIGHSPRVRNVTTGTVGGWPFRTFDFHCEGGHGPAREARSYVVALAGELDDFGRGGGSIGARRQVLVLACPMAQGGVSMPVIERAVKLLAAVFPPAPPEAA
ncbi:MAG: hypothetical protein NTV86_01230 [Planctomycetota bacterium]|nr:hypothetical protein [Planctomycetota bacterium]